MVEAKKDKWFKLFESDRIVQEMLLSRFNNLQTEAGEEGSTWVPFPETFCDPPSAEVLEPLAIHLTYPPFPWLDETRPGMHWGHYFDCVEIVGWVEPTQEAPGIYTYRCYRGLTNTGEESPIREVDDEDLSF